MTVANKTNSSEACPLLGAYNDAEDDVNNEAPPTRRDNTVAASVTTTTASDKRDINKNVLKTTTTIQQPTNWQFRGRPKSAGGKYVTWTWRFLRRKQFLGLLAVALLILYVNSTLSRDEPDERIPVLHYSHVPGMKDEQASAPVMMTTEASRVSVAGDTNTNNKTNNIQNSTQSQPNSEWPMKNVRTVETPAIILNATPPHAAINAAPALPAIALATAASFASAVTRTKDFKTDSIKNSSSSSSSSSSHKTTTTLTNQTLQLPAVNDLGTNSFANVSLLTLPPSGYLVWSERCKMPNIDPYLPEIMKFFKREKYKPCSSSKPLTRVSYNESMQRYVLQINDDAVSSYSKSGAMDCCYQSIERNFTGLKADQNVSLSDCKSFHKKTILPSSIDNIIVKCLVKKKEVYINGHAMMPERKEIRKRLDEWQQKDNRTNPSVLMIGIDSISRINLIRAMPKTAQYLYDNEWFEMSGYNKIDDNTFPNLMAVLTGRNKTMAFRKCQPTKLRGLDNCSFIWHTFRDHGYVTAYGEDEASINTFNYLKVGFEKPPVDYYLRPFLISAEKHLHIKKKSGLTTCLGYQHSAEFVYDYAVELAKRYKNDPFFGLFWTNTFSHNAISDCSAMDERMVEYLKRFASLGTLENTIVIFFSDHGMRFGPTRKTLSGHLEERLPFMFLWLPQRLKQAHPEFVNALSVNKNRLTNPYDLHMTLKHVLALTGRVEDKQRLAPAEDCPRCQTLLEPVPHNRSCDETAIDDHWCTCIPYQSIYRNSKTVHKLAKATVDYINSYVAEYQNRTFAKLCATLQLDSVENAYRAQRGGENSADIYRIIFYTKPNKALFEATVRYSANGSFEITGEISRLNMYISDSACVKDGGAKKYCSCRKKKLF